MLRSMDDRRRCDDRCPFGVLDWRRGHLAVIVTALRAGSEDAVTIERSVEEL
jgi:hypothetical protein